MNVFELMASIKLDSSGLEKGLKQSEGLTKNYANGLKATTVAAGQIIAQMAQKAVSEIGSIVGGAIDGFAEYEQLIGGVNKIFGAAGDTVIKNAEKAYISAGMSANTYMQTVTSFSASLVQSLGGDTQQAAELANQAIIDMGDNVNTYGSDMESVQRAYMGFAKRNFTMLDNLKLGYGGTATEMLRLVNDSKVLNYEVKEIEDVDFATMIKAIHTMQYNMGIAGTTAKEAATTISGSKGSLNAAWNDLLTSVAEGDETTFLTKMANFEESFGTYLKNMLPRAISTIGGSGALIEGLSSALSENISEDTFSQMGVSLETAITGVFSGLTNVGQWLINGLTTAFQSPSMTVDGAGALGESIGTFISTTISGLFENGGSILSGVVTTAFNLGKGIFDGLFAGFFGGDGSETKKMQEAIGVIDDTMRQSMQEASDNAAKANGIIAYMDELIAKNGENAAKTSEWAKAVEDLERVLPNAKQIIADHKDDVDGVTEALGNAVEGEKELAIVTAQRKALQEKLNALAVARGELGSAQGALEYAQWQQGWSMEQINSNAIIKAAQAFGDIDAEEGSWLNVFTGYKGNEEGFEKLVRGYFQNAFEDAEGATEQDLVDLTAYLKAYRDSTQTVEETSNSISDLQSAVQMAESSYNTANAALSAWTASLRSNTLGSVGAIGGGYGHAMGLDFVPYDNYRARLHRGEAVLTAAEATEWRRGGNDGFNSATMADMIGASVERALSKAGIYMDGSRVGELTTRTVSANIRADSNLRTRALGG